MVKRLALCLCLLFMCYSLSGCALLTVAATYSKLEEGVKAMQEDSVLSTLQQQVADNNRFAQSANTKKLGDKALKKQAAATQKTFWDYIPGISNISAAYKTNAAKKAVNAYNNACASDKTLIKARESAGFKALASNWSLKNIPTFFLVLAGLFIVLFLLGLLKRQKAVSKAIRRGSVQVAVQPAVATAQAAPQISPSNQVNANFAKMNMNPEKQAKLAQKMCAERGFNYQEMLAQYGGDPIALSVALMSM